MKIIDGRGFVLGRLASLAAKQALRGEEVVIVNSREVIITGNRHNIEENYHQKRGRVGTLQVGPKYPKRADLFVKRSIRGMLPNYREGRGKESFKRIKCYVGVPKEYEGKEMIKNNKMRSKKFVMVSHITK